MAKHRDSGEAAARDMTIHALVEFAAKAGLREPMREALTPEQMEQLDAGSRRHERRERRR